MSGAAEAKKSRLADLFYETETEYYGMPPFGLLDEVGEGVVGEVMRMFERCPKTLQSRISFLSEAQIEAVYVHCWALVAAGHRARSSGPRPSSSRCPAPLSCSSRTA